MTKEIIFEVENTSKKENTTATMSTLDKIIIVWFIAKVINIFYLLFKRIFKK